jgi:hypothetical protein
MGQDGQIRWVVMRSKLLVALVLSAGPVLAQAQVDPAIHKLCIEAKDYEGCVRAMKGETQPTRVITQEGAAVAEGNACPAGYGYRGGGLCQSVVCPIVAGGNDPLLAGKNHKCGNAPFWSGWVGRLPLRWGDATARAFFDENCPTEQLEVGWTSTCNYAPKDWEPPAARAARAEKEGPKCDFKLKVYKCSYNAYLNANPGMKKWAELNPELAQQQRVKLQSVD